MSPHAVTVSVTDKDQVAVIIDSTWQLRNEIWSDGAWVLGSSSIITWSRGPVKFLYGHMEQGFWEIPVKSFLYDSHYLYPSRSDCGMESLSG